MMIIERKFLFLSLYCGWMVDVAAITYGLLRVTDLF